jgi:hypothetical protein
MAVLFSVLIVLSSALSEATGALDPVTSLTGADLVSLAQHASLARLTFGLGMVSDLVLIPGIAALSLALKRLDRDAMLLASAFLALYVLMDLLVTGMNVVALVAVAQNYAADPTGPSSPSFALAVSIRATIGVSLPLSSAAMSVGILLVGWTVRAGTLGRVVPYLSYFAGVVGLLYGVGAIVPGFNAFLVLSAFAELAWFALVGWKLLRFRPLVGPSTAIPA